MLSFASNHGRTFCILIKWFRQFRFYPVFFVFFLGIELHMEHQQRAICFIHAGIYFVSHLSLFFSLSWIIFNFYERDFQLWAEADTHFTLCGKLLPMATYLMLMFFSFSFVAVHRIWIGTVAGSSAYADVDDNNEHDTAAAILMGLYWSLVV